MLPPIIYVTVPVLDYTVDFRFEKLTNTEEFRSNTNEGNVEIRLKQLDDHSFATFWEIAYKTCTDIGRYTSSCLVEAEELTVKTLDGEYVFDAFVTYNWGNVCVYLRLSNTSTIYQMKEI